MTTTTHTTAKKTATSQSASRAQDATTLLRADHKLVSGLFEDFEKARSPEKEQMFPKAKKSGLDLRELGRQMQQRKQELMAEQVL